MKVPIRGSEPKAPQDKGKDTEKEKEGTEIVKEDEKGKEKELLNTTEPRRSAETVEVEKNADAKDIAGTEEVNLVEQGDQASRYNQVYENCFVAMHRCTKIYEYCHKAIYAVRSSGILLLSY